MADVRQLLRAERASRRITHPHASYTKDGKLLCNLCEVLVKSEAQWQSHLHSTQHLLRSQRAKEAEDVRGTVTKKRKAESPVSEEESDERKRARANEDETTNNGYSEEESRTAEMARLDTGSTERQTSNSTKDQPSQRPPEADVDEAELAAFEQELASLEQATSGDDSTLPTSYSALNAEATISAAPMTAEELAAQAREEQSEQRGKKDAELEAEREDAARLLEDEFEEMEGLEERVRRLREKREALRTERNPEAAREVGTETAHELVVNGVLANEGDVSEDDDEEYEDDWGFGSG